MYDENELVEKIDNSVNNLIKEALLWKRTCLKTQLALVHPE